jgi:catechol 2,3-dioxygenase-like lactoylglutathione lyase family enzyme
MLQDSGQLKMSSVMLSVESLERSLPFYRDMLGLKVTGRIEDEFVRLDVASNIELLLRERKGKMNPGNTEFVFEVHDIFESYESLKARGVNFTRLPRAVTANQDSELFATDFRDPDGHILSIISWVPKKR